MQTEQINIKLMPELMEEVNLISKILHIPKNEWVRNTLAYEVKKELKEHKLFIAKEFFQGKVSKQELIKTLGKRDAEEIMLIHKTTQAGFKDAKKLAKSIKKR